MSGAFWQAAAFALLATAAQASTISIQYPVEGTVFPRDISAPTFIWRDPDERATAWRIEVSLPGRKALTAAASGQKLAVGPIDPDCVGAVPPELPAELAGSRAWRPEPAMWNAIRQGAIERPATARDSRSVFTR